MHVVRAREESRPEVQLRPGPRLSQSLESKENSKPGGPQLNQSESVCAVPLRHSGRHRLPRAKNCSGFLARRLSYYRHYHRWDSEAAERLCRY